VKLVQEAQSSKAPGQQLADRAAFWLVLVALVGGTLTLIVWLLAGRSFSQAILFAITVVVITCPDALGLATPTAIMVGTGLGAKRGILFKNAAAIEAAARAGVVVMDKTGTLTKGEPEVTELHADGLSEMQVLALAAAVERDSEHPLAEAIVRRAEQLGAARFSVTDFENVPGDGALATGEGRRVAAANAPPANGSPPSLAFERCSPKFSRPTRQAKSPNCSERARKWRWSATVSMTPPRWPRPTSE